MKPKSNNASKVVDDSDVPPMTRQEMRSGVMGKYAARLMADSNLVRISPKLRKAFPNEQSVNQALQELLNIQQKLASLTAEKPKRRKSA